MARHGLPDEYIQQYLEQSDSSCSEVEDFEEFSEHDTDSEQEGELFLEPPPETAGANVPLSSPILDITPEYLEDIPVSILRRGYYLGKDNTTEWTVKEPSQRVRTRSHNIVLEAPGPKGDARQCLNILDAWNLFFPHDDLQLIVDYTNMYIDKRKEKYQRTRDCKHTDLIEMRALFGLLYFVGRLRGAHLNTEDLWATDGTGSDICLATMSRPRFHFLLACVRFDNMHTRLQRREHDKLTAIREVFNNFSSRIKQYYSMHDQVTIDEKLEKTRGRCPFRQYIPSKPGKYGIKIQILADAISYYTYNMEVYVGKNPGPCDVSNAAIDLVKRLVEPIKHTHRNIVMDNWFTSFQLLQDLYNDYGLTALGTVRKNKKEIPPTFVSNNREIYSSMFGFQENCTLVSYVPKKGKVVLLASTMHHDARIDVSTGEKKKPEMITDYNSNKCGVDVVDEMCGTYSVSRITKRWPLVIFYGLLNIGGINAYVIVKANEQERSLQCRPRRQYIKTLALSLIKPHVHRRSSIPNLPLYIKEKMKFILRDSNKDEELPNNEPTNETMSMISRKRCATSRCQVCPPKKDRKTNSCCQSCLKMLCREHSLPVCSECIQKIQ